MLAQLIPLKGGDTITLTKDVTLVGRKEGLCDLVVDRKSVSKLQCLIVKTDGLLYIRDLCSTNGTKVNGQKVIRGALLPGDELAFASVKFKVHLGPAPPEGEGDVSPHEQTEMMSFPGTFEGDFEELDRLGKEVNQTDSDVRVVGKKQPRG